MLLKKLENLRSIHLNIEEFNYYELFIGLFFITSSFFINPFYLLFLGALIEKKLTLPTYINYVIAFSIAFSISNREIGSYWVSLGGNLGEDDALNYLSFYHDFKVNSYVLRPDKYFRNLLEGKEPLWFIFAETIGNLFFFNDKILVFLSVSIPVFILHRTFIEISPFFCFNSLIFYILIPESFHTLYHLWRFSLSSSILYYGFIKLIKHQKIPLKYLLLALSAHISAILLIFSFYLGDTTLRNKTISSVYTRIYIIFLLLIKIIIIGILLFSLLKYLEFDKLFFYLGNDVVVKFNYNFRHLIYICISLFFLIFNKNKYIITIALLNIFLLILPFLLPEIGLVMERILILTTPFLPLIIAFHYRSSLNELIFLILPMFFLFIYYSFKLSNQLFYQFISNGNFFSFYNGILYNIIYHQ